MSEEQVVIPVESWQNKTVINRVCRAMPSGGGLVICSIVEFTGSYGHRHDRMEIQGLLNKAERKYDTVVGFLSAEKVFDRIKADLERRKKRDGHQEVELPNRSV